MLPVASLILLNKGGLMRNDRIESSDAGKPTVQHTEIDSAPKTYTLREQIFSGLKMGAIVGIIFLFLWLFDKISFD